MKRFLWFALWLATAGGAFAQEADPYAGQKAQIREIKLSNEYYYSDVSSEDPEETRGMARQLLVLAIQQEEPEALGVDSLVADSCRYIGLKRIDQPRFFAYISKEAVAVWLFRKKHPGEPLPFLAATPADTLAGRQSGPLVVDTAVVAAPDSLPVPVVPEGAVPPVDSVAVPEQLPVVAQDTLPQSPADTVRKVPVPLPVDTLPALPADTLWEVVRDTVQLTVTDTLHVTLRDTTRVTVVDTVRTQFEVKTTGNDRLDKIIAMKTIAEVQEYFIAEKLAGRMMFGKMDSATSPENCYILVFARDGKVVAVLDKGHDARLNFTTGKSGDRLANYNGYGIIWFLLY